jgi:hypothetical protein
MAMHKFCDMRCISYKKRSDLRREPISDYVRFCLEIQRTLMRSWPNSAASGSRSSLHATDLALCLGRLRLI